jgi:hypothetical protein
MACRCLDGCAIFGKRKMREDAGHRVSVFAHQDAELLKAIA